MAAAAAPKEDVVKLWFTRFDADGVSVAPDNTVRVVKPFEKDEVLLRVGDRIIKIAGIGTSMGKQYLLFHTDVPARIVSHLTDTSFHGSAASLFILTVIRASAEGKMETEEKETTMPTALVEEAVELSGRVVERVTAVMAEKEKALEHEESIIQADMARYEPFRADLIVMSDTAAQEKEFSDIFCSVEGLQVDYKGLNAISSRKLRTRLKKATELTLSQTASGRYKIVDHTSSRSFVGFMCDNHSNVIAFRRNPNGAIKVTPVAKIYKEIELDPGIVTLGAYTAAVASVEPSSDKIQVNDRILFANDKKVSPGINSQLVCSFTADLTVTIARPLRPYQSMVVTYPGTVHTFIQHNSYGYVVDLLDVIDKDGQVVQNDAIQIGDYLVGRLEGKSYLIRRFVQ